MLCMTSAHLLPDDYKPYRTLRKIRIYHSSSSKLDHYTRIDILHWFRHQVMICHQSFFVSTIKPNSKHEMYLDLVIYFLGVFVFVTGFYPSPKSFWSCTHVNRCQNYILYINLHILLNILCKTTLNIQESRKSIKFLKI